MTFIDWSDPEGLFGLLLEYVADERAECADDPERREFLSDLLGELKALERDVADSPETDAVRELKSIRESIDREFVDDPVMRHFEACIEELERLQAEGIG